MIPRRTLEELILIYETENILHDTFCEGPSDAAVLRFFVDGIPHKSIAVLDATQIEWPKDIDFVGGNRAKIVYLSQQLSARNLNGVCVVDQDLDTIEDATPLNRNLVKTDYACMDMYGLDPDNLSTYLYSTYNVQLAAASLDTIFEACRRLFVIRFLRERHATGSSIADARRIIADEVRVEIDVDVYLHRCKQLNGFDVRWDVVIQHETSTFQKLLGDFRNYVNVHDLGDILAAVIRARKGRSVLIDPQFIVKYCSYALLSARDFRFPLFSELSCRLT